jgi:transcriptional regulator with XRE-family HTH domain
MATKWNDLKHKSSPEVRATLKREAHDELERIGFGKLRQARQQTQVAIAERLKIPQGAVSRMEKRSDLLLSTLREYVGALGGKLELRAVFPDADFELETLETRVETKSAKKRRPTGVATKSAAGR